MLRTGVYRSESSQDSRFEHFLLWPRRAYSFSRSRNH